MSNENPKGYYCPKCDTELVQSLFKGYAEHNLSEAFWLETRNFADGELKRISLLKKRYNPNTRKGRSGIVKAIQELRLKNPSITKEEALLELQRSGFDFLGRIPRKSVLMAWYSAQNKVQQAVPAMLGKEEK